MRYKTNLCHQWLANGTCPVSSTCKFAHGTNELRVNDGEPSSTLFKAEICKFWKNGWCAHADQCTYAHGPLEMRMPSSSKTEQASNCVVAHSSSVKSYKPNLCHQWLANGTCPLGSACNFAHGTNELRVNDGEPSSTLFKAEICEFWKNGWCAHADQCTYAHGPLEMRMPSSSKTEQSESLSCPSTHPALSVPEAEVQEAPLSLLDDIFNKAPYLNYVKDLEAELNKTIAIGGREDRATSLVSNKKTDHRAEVEGPEAEEQWQLVQSGRNRARRASAVELPRHSSPFTDDGYHEDFACSEGFNSRSNTPGSSIIAQTPFLANNNGMTKENPFWKTQLCSHWKAFRDGKGLPCRRGRQCFFAHGMKELQKLGPLYFKTQLCEYWNQEEPCPYGECCNFAHGEGELRKTNGVKVSNKPKGAPNASRLFFNRHRVSKPRGTQTVQPFQSFGQKEEKVVVVKDVKK